MLNKLIVNKFISKNNKASRQSYGLLGGIVGIIVNIILFIIKFIIGYITSSVAITADAFNNLSDVGTSIVTIVGFKIADKPADKDHPFGHGRGEYISGLVVSFAVLLVGFEFAEASVKKILHPTPITFALIPVLILTLSITFKAWLGSFHNYLSKLISSETLNATSFDSYADVVITSCAVLSIIISRFSPIPIDGYIGLLVSGFLIFTGYRLVKSTINPLLGEAPNPELVTKIIDETLSYKDIIGTHDLIVHSYGSNKYLATIHAEIPSDISTIEAHDIIDRAENEISNKLGIHLVIHMDPVNVNNSEIDKIKYEVNSLLKRYPCVISTHDFRTSKRGSSNMLLFDIVVSNDVFPFEEGTLLDDIKKTVGYIYPEYTIKVGLDRDYTQL